MKLGYPAIRVIKMRKLLVLVLCLSIINGCSSPSQIVETIDDCEIMDGTIACFNNETKTYKIEENARVKIAGLDSELLNAIIALWDETYPQYSGLIQENEVEYSDLQALSLKALDYDIIYTSEENAAFYLDQIGKLDEHLLSIHDHSMALDKSLEVIQQSFIPFTSDSAAFIYNKTMLNALGIDAESDENADGMPDSIDSWEEIFLIADMINEKHPTYKRNQVLITFPFSLNEPYLSYFMFTSNNFRLFDNNDGLTAGFEDESFLKALEFIEEASNHVFGQTRKVENRKTIYTPYTADGYIYRWDRVYTAEVAPFGLVASWMDIDTYMKSLKSEIVVSPIFPTYQNTMMVPFVTNSGFVYKQSTVNKSATFAVLDFLHSDAVYQLIVDKSNLLPYYYDDINIDFTNKTNTKNRMISYALSDNVPLIALPDNIYVQAFNSYLEIDIMEVVRQLWDKTITKEEAQQILVDRYKAWYNEQCNIQTLEDELTNNTIKEDIE